MPTSVAAAVLVPLMASVFGLAVSVPPRELGAHVTAGGLYSGFWSVLDDCFGRGGEDAAVCLKCKALTVLDWALSNPSAVVADGVLLTARAGQSPGPNGTWRADRDDLARHDLAVLDAVSDPDRKHALLDDMLATRLEEFVSTRAIAANGGAVRGKKKSKRLEKAIMMACMMALEVMWPVVWSVITLTAVKALTVSKIALTLSSFMAMEKFLKKKHVNKPSNKPQVRGSPKRPYHVIQS